MDIDTYIRRHQEEWTALERACKRGSRALKRQEPERIRETLRLYHRVSAHLSEVQTEYRDPRLESYLTSVVARAHAAIYGPASRSIRRGAGRLGTRYLVAMRRSWPYAGVCAAVLLIVGLGSLLWVAGSPEAQAGLLPPEAHDAIERAGGERADFGMSPGSVSTFILVNNVRVTLLAFAVGITFGIATLVIVVQNALLLGVLAGAFTAAGKAGPFWALVLPHGILELLAVCIGAGAGLRIGWALVDPGDRPRTRALREEAAESLLVVLGTVPALGIAALIEGFVTGRTGNAGVEISIGVVAAIAYVGASTGLLLRREREPQSRPAALIER